MGEDLEPADELHVRTTGGRWENRSVLPIDVDPVEHEHVHVGIELQISLHALKTDYLDIFQLHHLNTEEERNQALGPGGALEAAQQAREEGLVRFIGVTGHDWVQVEQAVRTGHFDTLLV